MREESRNDIKTEYFATVLWSIGRLVGGEEYPIPTWDEMLHPKPKDTRSTAAIVGGLIQKLGLKPGEGVNTDAGTVSGGRPSGAG